MSAEGGPATHRPTRPEDFPRSGPYALGTIWQRALARTFDVLLVALPLAVALLATAEVRDGQLVVDEVPGWVLPAQVGIQVVYETIAVALWGRTLGKLLLGLRVTRFSDGKRPGWGQSAQRIVLPSVAWAIPIDGSGVLAAGVYLTSVFEPLRRGWHDRYAGTIVLRTR